jgi:hypothetical protein
LFSETNQGLCEGFILRGKLRPDFVLECLQLVAARLRFTAVKGGQGQDSST